MPLELLPRIGILKPPVNVLGSSFTLCIANTGERLKTMVMTPVSPETLSRFYGVRNLVMRNYLNYSIMKFGLVKPGLEESSTSTILILY